MSKDKREFEALMSKLSEFNIPGKAFVSASGQVISIQAIDRAKNLYADIIKDMKVYNDYKGFSQHIKHLFNEIGYQPNMSKVMTSLETSDFSKAVSSAERSFKEAEKLIQFIKQDKKLSKSLAGEKEYQSFLKDFNHAKQNYNLFVEVYKTGELNIDQIELFTSLDKQFKKFNIRMKPLLENEGYDINNIVGSKPNILVNGKDLKKIVNKFSKAELQHVIDNKDNLPYDNSKDLIKLAEQRQNEIQKDEVSKVIKKHKENNSFVKDLHVGLDDNAIKKDKGLDKLVSFARELVGKKSHKTSISQDSDNAVSESINSNKLASNIKGIKLLTDMETNFKKADKIFKLADSNHKRLNNKDIDMLEKSNFELSKKLNKISDIKKRFLKNQSFSENDLAWLKDNIKPIAQAVETSKALLNDKGIKTTSVDKVKVNVEKVKADLTPQKAEPKKGKERG